VYGYPYNVPVVDLPNGQKNPSYGTCVPFSSVNQSAICGTGTSSSALCNSVANGDLACIGGICRFVSNSTDCSSSSQCGFFGTCGCGNGTKAPVCNGILSVPACYAELNALRNCSRTWSNPDTLAIIRKNFTGRPATEDWEAKWKLSTRLPCPSIEVDGVPAWIFPNVMSPITGNNRSCFLPCLKEYQAFSCCRGRTQDCVVEGLDVSGLVTGLFAFVILVAVSIVILLEIPQNYFSWVWLILCWWHMWRDDIIDFIKERPSQFPLSGPTGNVQEQAINFFAPKDGAKCQCQCAPA
jgi:hypothetical protein